MLEAIALDESIQAIREERSLRSSVALQMERFSGASRLQAVVRQRIVKRLLRPVRVRLSALDFERVSERHRLRLDVIRFETKCDLNHFS